MSQWEILYIQIREDHIDTTPLPRGWEPFLYEFPGLYLKRKRRWWHRPIHKRY